MRYPLLSRFQGGLVASLMGASLVKNPSLSFQIDQNLSLEINLVMSLNRCLIENGQLLKAHWQQLAEQYANQLNYKSISSSSVIALITLPLSLFFHDNPPQFRQQLDYLNEIWHPSAETLEEVLYWQDTISLILREKVNPSQLLPTLLERHPQGKTPLKQQLEQVQTFLEQKYSLKQVISQLGNYPLPLAYYCFSCTPEDIDLCILRAIQVPNQPFLTGALVGMLAGVYNGFHGIAIAWQLKTQQMHRIQTVYQQASSLFAVWCGVLCLDNLPNLSDYALASPLVIQPRTVIT